MRRNYLLAAVALGLLSFQASAQKYSFSKVEVDPAVSPTPQFSAGGVQNFPVKPEKWVVIVVKYTPAASQSKDSEFTWVDDFSIKFEALLNDGKRYALLHTVVNYWSVCFDGTEKYAVALIPPVMLKRYTGKDGDKIKQLLKDMPIRVTFMINGAELKPSYYPKDSEGKMPKIFEAAASSPSINRVEGGILNTAETPWSVLNFDAFQLIRTNNKK